MYQDPSRWSMALQSYVQLTMLQVHEQPQVCYYANGILLAFRSVMITEY